jgi:hypothetical protein
VTNDPTTEPGERENGPAEPRPTRDDVSEQSTVNSSEYAAENDDD